MIAWRPRPRGSAPHSPSLSCDEASAPNSSRILTHSTCCSVTARRSGVRPRGSFSSRSNCPRGYIVDDVDVIASMSETRRVTSHIVHSNPSNDTQTQSHVLHTWRCTGVAAATWHNMCNTCDCRVDMVPCGTLSRRLPNTPVDASEGPGGAGRPRPICTGAAGSAPPSCHVNGLAGRCMCAQ